MHQNALVEIYEGDNFEKRDNDIKGTAHDKSTGKKVYAIAAEEGNWFYNFTKAKTGKKYFIVVKTQKDPFLDFNEGAYSYTTITASSKENDKVSIEKIFTFDARPNQYEEWNAPLTKNSSDFGVARYGDSSSYINFKEKSQWVFGGSDYDKYYVDKYTNKYYYYFLRKFYKGAIKESHQYSSQYPQLLIYCLSDFRQTVQSLKDKYGTPDYYTADIFSFNNTDADYTKWDDFRIGQEIMNGFKTFEYKFKSERSIITCRVSSLEDGYKQQPWAYTITTSYEKRDQ